MVLVSIITPSFNQAAYLEQTILSVLNQDYPHIEYLVIDGASTDGSVDIIRKYVLESGGLPPNSQKQASGLHKINYWVSEKDRGQADAINKGFARAAGGIVAWLNSDDTYLPGTIRAAVQVFEENPDVVLVYGDMLAVDEHGRTINTLKYSQLTLEDLLCFQIIGQPAVFIRRSAMRDLELDPTFHFMLDHRLWIQLAQQGRILHVPQTWAAARYHPEAKNRAQAPGFGRDAFRILDWARQDPSLGPIVARISRRALASAWRVNARYFLDGSQPGPALSAWTKALFIHPPTALARLNIIVSSILTLLGLGKLREKVLQRRKENLDS